MNIISHVVLFGDKIRKKRLESNIGLRELARNMKISCAYLSRIENGECRPSEELIHRISNQLNIDFDELMLSIGRIPSDVENYIVENPVVLKRLRVEMGSRLEPLLAT